MLDALHGLIVATAIASTPPSVPAGSTATTGGPQVPGSQPAVAPAASPAADPTPVAPAPVKPAPATPPAPAVAPTPVAPAGPAKPAPAVPAPAVAPTPPPEPTCVVVLGAATSPADKPCVADVTATTGGSGNVAGQATGGSSGDASAVIEVPVGAPVPVTSSTASSGAGGSAVVVAASGATGDAESAARCTIVFTASHVIITGNLDLICFATAIARSGSSGTVQGTATGGNAGGADAGGSGVGSAALVGTGAAAAGAAGTGQVVGTSGATGAATATASCSFVLVFQDVVITGRLRLICVALARSDSGSAGAVTAGAAGGTVGSGPGRLGAGTATAASGTVGTALATTSCSTLLSFTGVTIGGGMFTQCDSGPGTATVGVAGVTTQTPRTGSTAGVVPALLTPGSLSAVTGAGGSATVVPTSGATGSAAALASCVLGATAQDLRLTSSVVLSCAASALALSGSSGTVTGIAVGGSSGNAQAGFRMVTPVVVAPSPTAVGGSSGAPTVVAVVFGDIVPPAVPAGAAVLGTVAGSAASSRLAYTGVPVAELTGLGGVAMLLGATMLGMSRPRRRASAAGNRG